MARISEREAQAWAEGTKLTIQTPFTDQDLALLEQIEEEVLARVAVAYPDQTTWTDATTTPKLVRVAITKMYVAWYVRRQYSENLEDGDAAYAEQVLSSTPRTIHLQCARHLLIHHWDLPSSRWGWCSDG